MESLGSFSFTWDFLLALASIVLIDLVLAGDNAVVIALAVRNLPPKQRLRGILLGAGAAVLLRVCLTFFASKLLGIGFVKLAGGILIAWIAVKLFIEGSPDEAGERECKTVWQAMWTIIVADLVMSTDNVLAVAGASRGNLLLLIFGLGLSIPLVVCTSSLLARLMDRFPVIVYAGAAILGKVSAEMILTDPWVIGYVHLSQTAEYVTQAACAVGVIVAGKLWLRLFPSSPETQVDASGAECVPAQDRPKAD